MIFTNNIPTTETSLPDHTQLPESDGTFVLAKRTGGQNFQEHPQSILLTDSISPILKKHHPDGQYAIGQDCGIYWRITEPPQRGAEAPDWFYVPNVTPLLNDKIRRSYVLWQEYISPLIVLEFVSGDGIEERDKTPWQGKFWIYEQVIKPAFYGIYEVSKASVEVYHLIEEKYHLLPANERGHYPITSLGVELGIWQGEYQNMQLPWLRWWDLDGNLLLDSNERVEQERFKAEQERLKAEQEKLKNDRLIAQLRALGVEPEIE